MDVHFISGVVERVDFFFLVVYLAAQDEVGALQITALDIPQQRDWGELEHNAWQTDLIHNNNLYLH